eukprot:3743962-Ditylum_brightwellii.AAC.1
MCTPSITFFKLPATTRGVEGFESTNKLTTKHGHVIPTNDKSITSKDEAAEDLKHSKPDVIPEEKPQNDIMNIVQKCLSHDPLPI